MKSVKFIGSVLLITATSMAGCSSSNEEDQVLTANMSLKQSYDMAKNSMDSGNFVGASQVLSQIDSKYPFGPFSHQVQLDLIYSYYKSGKTAETLATIDRFIRLNPNHSDVDYAYYMRGLASMESDNNLFQELLDIDRSDRDPSQAREAFEDFRRLIELFPNSKYAADARQRMLHIKERLARYEIEIARFYMRREAYVAAANRGRYVIEHFPDSPQVKQALEIMVASYEQLGLTELKANAMKTLKLNYPESEFIG